MEWVGRSSWRSGRPREALPKIREGLGGSRGSGSISGRPEGVGSPPKGPGSIGSPIQRAVRGQEWSGGPLGGLGGVERPFWRAESVQRSFQRANRVGSLSVRTERSGEVLRNRLKGLCRGTGGSGGVRRPSQMDGRGREALLEGWQGLGVAQRGLEGMGGTPGEMEGVGMLFQRARGAGRLYWRAGTVWEGQERLGGSPGEAEGWGGTPRGPGGVGRPFQSARTA